MAVRLALSGRQYHQLRQHLFPGDELEAVALLLCGTGRMSRGDRLVVRDIVAIPHDQILRRERDDIEWSVERHLLPLVERIDREGLSLVVMHCHPGGYDRFSGVDDEADRELFPSVHSWFDDERRHGAAVMLPDGSIFGRAVARDGSFEAFERISVAGDDLLFFPAPQLQGPVPEHSSRTAQTFGEGTLALLKVLRVLVAGASGTGSIVIEQLYRTGVGELPLVDDDHAELKNLNRIVNSRLRHAAKRSPKVELLAEAIEETGLGTVVEAHPMSVLDPAMAPLVASVDIVFGCLDGVEARHVLNELCSAYSVPLFDVGTHIEQDGVGGITHAVAAAHYIQPGGSSLLSREVYSPEDLAAETLRRTDPAYFEEQRRAGYLPGVPEDRPAVMPLNSMAATLGVTDFLARLHRFRLDPNGDFAWQTISLTHGTFENGPDGEQCPLMAKRVGLGDRWKQR